MSNLKKLTVIEAKLLFREPGIWLIGILLPSVVLLVIGVIFSPHRPEPELGGRRYIDLLAPSMVVISLATLGVNTMPPRLVKYRERGVLRRLSTTPIDPATLVIAQLLVNIAVAVGGLVLLLVIGNLAFQIPLPQNPIGFAVAFLARHVFAVRTGAARRRDRTDRRHGDRAHPAGVLRGDAPRRCLSAALAPAGDPRSHRRPDTPGSPDPARHLVRLVAAASATGDNGRDHAGGGNRRAEAVPVGVNRLT